MRFRRRAALALSGAVLVGGLVTATSGPASAATCPSAGHLFKTASDRTVYLTGSDRLYFFPYSSDYFGLYTSYSGISTVSDSVQIACINASPQKIGWALADAKLVKSSGSAKVYIYDYSAPNGGGYRWITSQSVFDTYGFASSKIVTVSASSIAPIASNWT
ncbi:MAG: hypothetical protein HOY69_05515 [Streptomyces sp.]|nr:hypothetical protein [Streptomyces sp.]